jgi:hypothetical protein
MTQERNGFFYTIYINFHHITFTLAIAIVIAGDIDRRTDVLAAATTTLRYHRKEKKREKKRKRRLFSMNIFHFQEIVFFPMSKPRQPATKMLSCGATLHFCR